MKSAIKTIATATAATIVAVGILAFSSETERKRQIERAKRNIAERKAQMQARKAELEAELKALKSELKELDKASEALETIEPQPEITTEPEIIEVPQPQPQEEPAEFSLENQYLSLTIRELKAIAKSKKLKGYGNLRKAELAKKLAELG